MLLDPGLKKIAPPCCICVMCLSEGEGTPFCLAGCKDGRAGALEDAAQAAGRLGIPSAPKRDRRESSSLMERKVELSGQ